ncbi:hypothetical protein HGB07_06920, partial [Candidatus Roizmanbacteria bacterium]|nr:hypothetical protein [Candidatus Roizmanbacteria bacterium]
MSYNPKNTIPLADFTYFQSKFTKKTPTSISFPENSDVTKQEFAAECDINTIMRRYQSTGEMPVLNQSAPQYLDATGFDYSEAMAFVAGAKSLFNELPSHIRNRFDNDPAVFLDFTSNEANYSEMSEMGLL